MTVKIRQLKEPPLLSPPGIEQSPWMELSPSHIQKMRESLHGLKGSIDGYTSALAGMKRLGLDVSQETSAHERGMLRQLSKPSAPFYFISHAANMRTLGLDVSAVVVARRSGLLEELRGYRYGDMENNLMGRMASMMAEAGLDVSRQVAGHEAWIKAGAGGTERDRDWNSYALHLVEFRRLGLDVKDELKEHAGDMKGAMGRLIKEGNWVWLAHHAANLAELGLLAPNPGYKRDSHAAMPPLKKFAGGKHDG
jgi:hypothetical protein